MSRYGMSVSKTESRHRSPYAADCDVIRCYGGAMIYDKHLAATVHCVDDEIIGDCAAWIETIS